MYDNSRNNIGEKATELMSTHFIVKSIGTLIPSYLKGFLIEKYTNNIIFYISGLISFFIFTSAIILVEDRIKNHEKTERLIGHQG
jgi:undecaprenyl pyrophosphate phosphatase UppP